jgi:general secretion pathway protein D
MSQRLLCLSLAVCLSVGAVHAQTPPAEEPAPAAQPDELVGPIKLPDADIDTVLGLLEIYTGRAILRPQQLPTATYRLVIDKKIPKSEAVLALETVLALNQIGVAPLGDKFLKVVALSQVKTEAPEMITGSTLDLPPSGRIATKVFQLRFLRVNEFVPQIQPLMTPGVANGIVPLDKANAAMITDTVSNLQRVEQLLQQIDQPTMAGLTPKFYTLQNGAKASDVVAKLRAMFQGPLQNQLGSSLSYSADDRTNQIILLADERQVPLFDELVAKLDVKAEPNTRNEVIYLKHASAKDVAPLLSNLVTGQTKAATAGGSTRPLTPQQPTPQPPQTPDASAAAAGVLSEGTNEFSSLITIIADERSNSVVVSGTVDDIRLVRGLVDKIDILLAQVRIEVVIAEVTLSDTDSSGIGALKLNVGTDTPATGDGHRGTHITQIPSAGFAGWNVTNAIINPLSFQAELASLGQRSNVKVLNANTIVTTHNKEAEFVVSQQLPIITNRTQAPTGTTVTTDVNPFATTSSVTYKDVGIDVKVTPLIGDDGSIQLKIDQKVDDVVRTVIIDQVEQPIIGHRQATSFINVSDGQMVVLGGLQTTKNTRSRNKLGFLFEIPVLSHLLGGRNNSQERTELLLFVRPHVIPVDAGTADATSTINSLSNKEQINQYLSDPSKQPKEKLLEKLK